MTTLLNTEDIDLMLLFLLYFTLLYLVNIARCILVTFGLCAIVFAPPFFFLLFVQEHRSQSTF